MSKTLSEYANEYTERLVFVQNRRSCEHGENPSKMLPDLTERLRQSGHRLLLEDYSLDIEEFRDALAAIAEKLGFGTIVKYQLSTGRLHDPAFNELRQAWKECRHDDHRIDEYEDQIDNRLQELVKTHYADPVADELWSRVRRPFPLTVLGCAERFIEEHRDDIRFCKAQDHYYIWGGKFWVPDTKKCLEAKTRVKYTIRRIKAEAAETNRDDLEKLWKGSETPAILGSILQAATLAPEIQIAPQDFDSHKWLLNCANATVHLNKPAFKSHPHSRQDYLTRQVPWEYDPKAPCPRWMKFLEEVTGGDRELQDFLQLAVGYGITGQISEKCLFFLHGPGDTGKTTFIETVSTMLGGGYARTAGFTSFIRGVKSGIRNDLARLQGVRFVAAAEAGPEDKFDVVLLKRLTGDDTITARFLYREYQEFRPEFKIFLAANHEPKLPADDEAVWRRFVVLPFDIQVKRKQHDLKDRLREEMPGILAWAVHGAWRYYANYYSQSRPLERPKRVQEAIEQYRARCEAEGTIGTAERANDKAKRLIKQFLDERCERAPGQDETPESLLKEAKDWAEERFEDGSMITANMLGRVLNQSGYEAVTVTRDRVNTRLWKDIKIKV